MIYSRTYVSSHIADHPDGAPPAKVDVPLQITDRLRSIGFLDQGSSVVQLPEPVLVDLQDMDHRLDDASLQLPPEKGAVCFIPLCDGRFQAGVYDLGIDPFIIDRELLILSHVRHDAFRAGLITRQIIGVCPSWWR
jgi:hypothetical protein